MLLFTVIRITQVYKAQMRISKDENSYMYTHEFIPLEALHSEFIYFIYRWQWQMDACVFIYTFTFKYIEVCMYMGKGDDVEEARCKKKKK